MPAKKKTPRTPLDRLRVVCLALPESHEVEAWGTPTFRVKNKLFAMYAQPETHTGNGRHGVWLNCAAVNQRTLIASDPTRYFSPPYVGPKGWIGVWIDKRPRWRDVEELVADAWQRTAPAKLVAQVNNRGPVRPADPD